MFVKANRGWLRPRSICTTAKRRKLIADDPMPYVRNLRLAQAGG
jgi:hypothetical protein